MRARRVDANHAEVMQAFRKMGCNVFDTSRVGNGYPDLNVSLGPNCIAVLVEIKDGEKPPSAQKLTEDEATFHSRFPVEIVKDMDDVARVVALLRATVAECSAGR